jgi:hypothetical protein
VYAYINGKEYKKERKARRIVGKTNSGKELMEGKNNSRK